MDEHVAQHLMGLYGMDPNMPHMAFRFPRLPPGTTHPMFKVHGDPTKGRLEKRITSASETLYEFQQAYQRHALGLFAMNPQIIPPHHPLHSNKDSAGVLKAENDMLLKENTELRKKLEKFKSHTFDRLDS